MASIFKLKKKDKKYEKILRPEKFQDIEYMVSTITLYTMCCKRINLLHNSKISDQRFI